MKRRDEDQLIHLAYGELESEESATLEAALSPRASELLGEYRSLNADIKLLNRIPEPQIGTERIREAILGQGLKGRRSLTRWAVLLVPVAAAAFAYAVVSVRLSSTSATVADDFGAMNPVMFAPAMQKASLVPETEITRTSQAVREDIAFPQPETQIKQAVLTTPVIRKHAFRSHSNSLVDPKWLALSNAHENVASSSDQTATSSDTQPVAEVASPAPVDDSGPAVQDEHNIIVVHDAQDRATGAQQATEVDPSANVVVGG
jgi:hypothetical protein